MNKVYKFKKQTIYKSKPFIKKVRELDSNFISKYIFNILMLFVLLTLTIVLLCLLLKHVNANIYAIRATFLFAASWSFVFLIWWIIQTTQYYVLTDNKTRILAIFSFLPIINIVMICLLFKQIKNKEFGQWFTWAFSKSKFENNPNNYKTKQWYLNLTALIIMLPLLGFLFFYSTTSDQFAEYHNLWFDGVHYFTIQTNLLCLFYVLIYVIYPRMNLFNNDSVLICLMSYIFIVSFTYNTLIFPFTIKDLLIDNPLYIVKGMWSHAVNPFMFIGVGIACMRLNSFKNPSIRDYLTLLKFGMIIPSVYLIYTLFLPFMSDKSVYGPITNCNPGTPNETPLFGLEYGSPFMLIPIISFWFIFVGIITMFWRIKYSFNKKAINLIKKQQLH